MPAQWTAKLIGKMHLNNITAKELAEYLHIHPKYLSAVLNGKRSPKSAEEKYFTALENLINERKIK